MNRLKENPSHLSANLQAALAKVRTTADPADLLRYCDLKTEHDTHSIEFAYNEGYRAGQEALIIKVVRAVRGEG